MLRRTYAPARSPTKFAHGGGWCNRSQAGSAGHSCPVGSRPLAASRLASIIAGGVANTARRTPRASSHAVRAARPSLPGYPCLDGCRPPRHVQSVPMYLNCAPASGGARNGATTFARNQDRRAGLHGLCHAPVPIGTRFTRSQGGRLCPSWTPKCSAIPYVRQAARRSLQWAQSTSGTAVGVPPPAPSDVSVTDRPGPGGDIAVPTPPGADFLRRVSPHDQRKGW